MKTYTKGPWDFEIYNDDETGHEPYLIRPIGHPLTSSLPDIVATVARCDDDENKQENTETLANARLIAAAPDLLRAAQMALETIKHAALSEFNIPQEYLENAIKKAKGGV